MAANTHVFLVLLCIFVFCVPGNGVYAFGAGNIPSFAYMEGKAFRHGDIEDALSELVKRAGGFTLGALIGKGSKFGGLDIKRIYFGNWLRDYSQAVDVAGLQKLQLQTIINLCMVLGFLAHGYATDEFEVTEERLGVYLPTEHIDNPKGYPSDARKYNPKLRGPVDPRELDIDPRTGMKNYIANENGNWDTSKALVRRTLEQCIHLGRQHRAQGRKQDEFEAYRLLGQALHTLEDFPAHSNFCELALVALGHRDIFVHVGDQVRIQTHNGNYVAPLVTGTFGSSDFIHSLLGEATDHISQASVSDLNAELDKARAKAGPGSSGSSGPSDSLRELLFNLPGGSGSEMERQMASVERIRAGTSQPGGRKPEDMSPQELHSVLWQVLSFRDNVVKKIEMTIEKIPGLGPLIEKLMDSISVFVFTTLEPFLKPIMKQATSGLMTASGEVINSHDQYEVFNDPRASDPTHSFLSKDHFNLLLNEPAGHLGRIILSHTVNLVVKAWDDASMNVRQVTEEILQCLFHPDFHDRGSKIQRDMMEYMRQWVQGLGNRQHEVLRRLSKDSIRNHANIRLAGEGGQPAAQGTYAQNAGLQTQHDLQGYLNQVPMVSSATSFLGKLSSGGAGNSGGQMSGGIGQAQALLSQFGVGPGGRKDLPPAPGSGFPGESRGYAHQHGGVQGNVYGEGPSPTTGEAAAYYSGTTPGNVGSSSYPDAPSHQGSIASAHFRSSPAPSAHPGRHGHSAHTGGTAGSHFPSPGRQTYTAPPLEQPALGLYPEPVPHAGYSPSYSSPAFPDANPNPPYSGYDNTYAPPPAQANSGFPSADQYVPPRSAPYPPGDRPFGW